MPNMTDVWWKPGQPRRRTGEGAVIPPLYPAHEGYNALCLLCSQPLGGLPAQDLLLEALVVGPAENDPVGGGWHAMGDWYYAAAIVLHHRCLAGLSDEAIEKFVAGLRMVRWTSGVSQVAA